MNFLTSYQQNKIKEIIRKSGIKSNQSDPAEYTTFLVIEELLTQLKALEKSVKELELKVKRAS